MAGHLDALITVPHGAPGNDATAPDVGRAIHEELRHLGATSLLLISRCCRYDRADMNRREGRGATFRRRVVEVIERARPAILIDVHSFPVDYPRFQGEDIAILRSVQDEGFLRAYARRLHDLAEWRGSPMSIGILPNAYPNDICVEAVERGHPEHRIVMAEHNEAKDSGLFGWLHAYAIVEMVHGRR